MHDCVALGVIAISEQEEGCVALVLLLEHGRLRRLGRSRLLYAARSVSADYYLSLLEMVNSDTLDLASDRLLNV